MVRLNSDPDSLKTRLMSLFSVQVSLNSDPNILKTNLMSLTDGLG